MQISDPIFNSSSPLLFYFTLYKLEKHSQSTIMASKYSVIFCFITRYFSQLMAIFRIYVTSSPFAFAIQIYCLSMSPSLYQ